MAAAITAPRRLFPFSGERGRAPACRTPDQGLVLELLREPGDFIARAISALMRCTIAAGVPAGATTLKEL